MVMVRAISTSVRYAPNSWPGTNGSSNLMQARVSEAVFVSVPWFALGSALVFVCGVCVAPRFQRNRSLHLCSNANHSRICRQRPPRPRFHCFLGLEVLSPQSCQSAYKFSSAYTHMMRLQVYRRTEYHRRHGDTQRHRVSEATLQASQGYYIF